MTSRPIIAVCLHDGFYGCGTGAGHSNRAFLDALTTQLGDDVDLLVLPIHIAESSPEYDARWHMQSVAIMERVNARVLPLDNGTNGRTRWGAGLASFQHLVNHAAGVLTAETRHRTMRLIIAIDVPFFGLPPLLPPELLRDLVLVPRSTAAIHNPEDRDRVAWENHGLTSAVAGGARIGAISTYMRQHLANDLTLPDSAFLDLPVGLRSCDWIRTPPPDDAVPEPARAGFWLAMGRAVPYKGFDDLLDALALIPNGHPPHLLLAAVSNKPEPTDYQRHLADRVQRLRIDATLITRFSPDTANLLAHPAVCGVVVPSRAEPFGRIPLEAHAAGAAPVIATTAGGLSEQVIDGETGFLAAPSNPLSLAAALTRALDQTDQQRQSMRTAARALAANRDHGPAVRGFLPAAAPWLAVEVPQPAKRA